MKFTVFGVFWKELKKQPIFFILSIVSTLAIQGFALAQPVVFKDFINIIATPFAGGDLSPYLPTLYILSGIYAAIFIGQRFFMYSLTEMEGKIKRDLHILAFDEIIRKSENFFVSQFTGALTRKVGRLPSTFEQIYDSWVMSFIPTITALLGAIVVLYLQHPLLGIALLIWVFLFVSLQMFLHLSQRNLRVIRSKTDTALHGATADAMSNRNSILLFSGFQRESNLIRKKAQEWFVANLAVWRSSENMWLWLGGLQVIIQVGMLFLGIYLWERSLISVGDFVLIHSYIVLITDRLSFLHNNIKRYLEAVSDAQETIDIMNTPLEVRDAENASALRIENGKIVFDNVTFKYGDLPPVFTDFNLTINGHEKVALIGTSGAGKSTVTKLLLRLYEISKGTLAIDDQDIRKVTQESLRDAIAFVPQEPLMFHRSLLENIRYGRPDATDEEVIEASKKAHCHEFIERTKEGYATLVGERGVKLSGGERQRVAIARAILKDAPILILDEATSSLDSESEHLIQEALTELMEGKTVVAIAHRLSTIMHMDRIIVVENGQVTLSGTHDELMNHDGNIYKKLFEIQSGGFIR